MKPSSAVTLALVSVGNAYGEGQTHHLFSFLDCAEVLHHPMLSAKKACLKWTQFS